MSGVQLLEHVQGGDENLGLKVVAKLAYIKLWVYLCTELCGGGFFFSVFNQKLSPTTCI